VKREKTALSTFLFSLFRYKHQPGVFVHGRARSLFLLGISVFVVLALRAIYIHISPSRSQSLERIANQQYQQVVNLSRYRGVVYDRRREPLAISIRVPSIYVNPKLFRPSANERNQLAHILEMPQSSISKIQQKQGYFAWLKRKVGKAAAAKIQLLDIKGIDVVMEPSRFYPAGASASNLIGYVGIDDRGLGGIERQYEEILGGPPARIAIAKDARGRSIVSELENAVPEQAGGSLQLTIDRAIQEITERALAEGVKTAKALGGLAIVSDPHTGRVLAMANVPSFDPNNNRQINIDSTKNQAMMNVFEPGSVIKPLVVAVALKNKTVGVNQAFDCENGEMRIGGRTIHDAHPPKTKFLTTEEIIMHSSNVCTYKIAKTIGTKGLYDGLRQFGIGEKIQRTGFPGEGSGGLSYWQKWIPVQFANIAFGQGLTVSALELVQAYGAIANGGKLMRPLVVEQVEGHAKESIQPEVIRQVVDPRTATRLRHILARTVEEAVVAAKLDAYTSGGKTGTSQKVDPKTKAYSNQKHLASFVGIAPIKDPHLVIYVQIDEPNQPTSYGSLWAAPVFKQIAEQTLAYLNVAHDRSEESTVSKSKQNSDATSTIRL
jgi:cell division protein FtsI (penicillin-binding protein 3)